MAKADHILKIQLDISIGPALAGATRRLDHAVYESNHTDADSEQPGKAECLRTAATPEQSCRSSPTNGTTPTVGPPSPKSRTDALSKNFSTADSRTRPECSGGFETAKGRRTRQVPFPGGLGAFATDSPNGLRLPNAD